MLKKIIIIAVIVVALAAMLFSVPAEKSHHTALEPVMAKVASQVAQEKTTGVTKVLKSIGLGNEEKTQKGYDKVGKAMAPALVKMVKVNDYLFFNVGKLEYEGTLYPVSLGLYGHVFILPLDKIVKAMSDTEAETK